MRACARAFVSRTRTLTHTKTHFWFFEFSKAKSIQTLNTLKRPKMLRKNARGPKRRRQEALTATGSSLFQSNFLTNFSFARARLKNAFSPATRGLIHLETPLTHWNTHSSGRKYGRGEERQVCVDARGTFSSPFFLLVSRPTTVALWKFFFFLNEFLWIVCALV